LRMKFGAGLPGAEGICGLGRSWQVAHAESISNGAIRVSAALGTTRKLYSSLTGSELVDRAAGR
jgi:hypothetical protein